MSRVKTLYVVIPCYNEESVLSKITMELNNKLVSLIKKKKISSFSRVLYVDDGSSDTTWVLIKDISEKNKLFTGISLSKNKGHQNALFAGLMVARKYADMVISMDADMQDDINAIDEMIEKFYIGCEIVYGVRKSRKSDNVFKRWSAQLFYKFMLTMGVDIVYNHADYRLTSKRVLNDLSNYKEVNLFLRGIFPTIGYLSDNVYYERKKRAAGKSKYSIKKMFSFAWDGITSFSLKPIIIIRNIGIIIFLSSIFYFTWLLICKNKILEMYSIACTLLIAGVQLISLGVVGEYVGKIYNEVKRRPRFIIKENLLKGSMLSYEKKEKRKRN